MKENSIEEDIKDIEKYISFTSKRENFSHDTDWNWNKDLANKIEHILSDYKRVLKENEQLSTEVNSLKKENEELKFKERSRIIGKYGDVEIHDVINRTLSNDYIPIQKAKDKIEEILNNGEYRIIFEGDAEFPDEATCIDAQKYIKLEKLQELLEGRK